MSEVTAEADLLTRPHTNVGLVDHSGAGLVSYIIMIRNDIQIILQFFVPLKHGGAMILKILAFSLLKYPKPSLLCMFRQK